ncbi:MAG: 5-methyltetrahydrofolate--homocysteine methyltransferase [Oscillospiraceae bacterium]|nr:5-methyltetrahydrofolate--homocysteine methyltransferase [Oscillospiraceae bacterium]MBR2807537.1 5-methyltetrahydrofolate--homocysteine methyltransferase [Oscillospiraceae bacterium]MBR3174705.1 5-methyltetrahydrofolate--homocysteine methyltransferase [Oscillospiraceae bacterium]
MEARLTGISRQETLRYLGYPGGPLPDDVLEQLETSEQELFRFAVPRVVWRLFDRDADGSLTGTDFTPAGADIREFLKDCDRVILMAATLGMETENLLRRTQARDMAKALILDAAASAAVENVCDNLCADLAEALAPQYLTDRFSPGYGDLPLSQQKELFRLLDVTRRIGVSLSESGLMVPQKSVTALIGVSDRPQPKRSRGCETCTMFADCAYRKDGKNCGKP